MITNVGVYKGIGMQTRLETYISNKRFDAKLQIYII